jgi:hypothetical protein
MAKFFDHITAEQAELIHDAPLFFVGSADPHLAEGPLGEGAVNVSPKGAAPLHLVSNRRVAYVDLPGSGNETARHAAAGGPVTVMVCAFDESEAAIVRLYGRARVMPLDACGYADALLAGRRDAMTSVRQVVEIDVERTMTSCGYGVPVMGIVRERRREDRGMRYKPKARSEA